MSQLETLKLSKINSWKLWDDIQSGYSCVQNLTSLTVDKCDKITYIFSSVVARELVTLQYLEISNCQMLEDIISWDAILGNHSSSPEPLSNEDVRTSFNSVTLVWFTFIDLLVLHLTEKDLNILLTAGYIPKLSNIDNLPFRSLEVSMAQSTWSEFLP